MAGAHAGGETLVEYLILITSAVVVSTAFRRLHVPPVIAYLAVGLLLGPTAAGVITDIGTIQLLAEFGVVFLLFSLGLEFSLPRMIALRRLVFGLGGWQVLLSSAVIFAIATLVGATQEEATLVAGAMALSSTAVVSKELVARNELNQAHGQQSMAVLLFQDIAAVIFLILIPFLAGEGEESIGLALALTLTKGLALFLLMLAIGKFILPPLFSEVGKAHSDELFVLTVLMVALLSAALTQSLGLSMALGAFIAGMMLSETHFKHQIEADIRPFRDLLLGLFFISVGMIVDLNEILANGHWILLLTLGLLLGKTILVTFLAYRFRPDFSTALKTGLYLSQGGEFGFALFALGERHQLMSKPVAAIVISTVIVSITLTPLLIGMAPRLVAWLTARKKEAPAVTRSEILTEACADLSQHAIICGFGRVGQTVARFLRQSELPMVALDTDPVRVSEASHAGEPVFYGNAERLDMLLALGLPRARLVVITYNDPERSQTIIRMIREKSLEVPILVRTRDDSGIDALKLAGATEVVPETLEASLMLVSQVLTLMQVPAVSIHRQIEEARRSRYRLLHGYYPGINSQLVNAAGQPLEKLHAIDLPKGAWACNRTLAEIKLSDCRIDSIRRKGSLIDFPGPEQRLEAGDTVILHGSAEQVEHAENRLLGG